MTMAERKKEWNSVIYLYAHFHWICFFLFRTAPHRMRLQYFFVSLRNSWNGEDEKVEEPTISHWPIVNYNDRSFA